MPGLRTEGPWSAPRQQPRVAGARHDWPGAEREARLGLDREDKPRIPALILLARVLVEQNRLDEALGAIDQAAARIAKDGAPPVRTVSSTRGDILARLGRNREAEAAFRAEMQQFPATTESYTRLAVLLASEQRFAEIEPALQAMVKAAPSTPRTYELAARTMADLGNNEDARAFRQRGRELASRERAAAARAGK